MTRTASNTSGCEGVGEPEGPEVKVLPAPEQQAQLLKQKIDILRNLIEYYSIDPALDPEGRNILAKDVAVLQGTIKDVCKLSFCATNEHTLRRVEKKCTLDEAKAVTCPVAKQHFKVALNRMRLTDRQQMELEEIREACLLKLRTMYEERQQLNMELVALMLPVRSVGGEMVDEGGAAKFERLSKSSIIPCLQANL